MKKYKCTLVIQTYYEVDGDDILIQLPSPDDLVKVLEVRNKKNDK